MYRSKVPSFWVVCRLPINAALLTCLPRTASIYCLTATTLFEGRRDGKASSILAWMMSDCFGLSIGGSTSDNLTPFIIGKDPRLAILNFAFSYLNRSRLIALSSCFFVRSGLGILSKRRLSSTLLRACRMACSWFRVSILCWMRSISEAFFSKKSL